MTMAEEFAVTMPAELWATVIGVLRGDAQHLRERMHLLPDEQTERASEHMAMMFLAAQFIDDAGAAYYARG